ncbi:YceI family protein [Myxococcota bacterium]
MKRLWIMTLPLAAFALEARAGTVKWNLDKAHSEIGFSVRHLAITNVKGKLKDFDAEILADEKGWLVSVAATVKTSSINTDNAKRDDHLRSDDFFNAAKYPHLSLKTRSIKWDGSEFEAVVDLTIRNVTKPVTFKGELIGTHNVNFGDGDQIRAGYQAQATINRHDFGLKFNRLAEGVAVVGDKVKITLEIEMSRKLRVDS